MKMKQYGAILLAIFTVSVILAAIPAMAVKPGPDHNNVGKHVYKINIIGRPNDWQGKDTGSNSKVIFISLITEDNLPLECTGDSRVIPKNEWTTVPVGGQRIYFDVGPFDVPDRDATDGRANVTMPVGTYAIYVRVLGKPGGCLNAHAYTTVDGLDYYYIGVLVAIRDTGAPDKVNVRSLFYNDGTAYFDDPWVDYFWVMQNNGLRNMQLIFYET